MRRSGDVGAAIEPSPACQSAVLRQVRALRGRSVRDAATAMALPLRTYQQFESGRQKLQVNLIFRFAAALDVDPYAVLLAIMLDLPGLAVSCADNKLATALVLELKTFHQTAGSSIPGLRTTQILRAVRSMFDALSAEALTEQKAARQLLEQGALQQGPPSDSIE